ncbi:hypothetical protein, variant [Verruconis gallopava]|uniref:Globin-sensor domain-containing protein n=1 Tax=Verruconis gallopava TaxID=253628 RepID=A0A0D1ZXV1_9PEZI|nr:uncharacterized protein PV09_09059 [Verruconis gallopava]XP_016209162.1 hypothetical protein, variant [Verruconis gallopava]KIV99291.1 hypothetical protein PV09_09059 [Verruconis gallopava]KIV99292.1 hypothetical protein, variant [Verruconis gallopava]
MAPARRVQHIDHDDIHSNLHARIQYLHSFLDFNASDIQALTVGSKYIRTSIPTIVDKVYSKLLQYDITAKSFIERELGRAGPSDSFPSKDSSQIHYRKLFMQGYLQKICSDPSKFEFWEYMDKVGMMHCQATTRRGLHVDYVHIGMTLAFIQEMLTDEILLHPRLKTERKAALIKAVGKVIWIQNDLFARWHVKDGNALRRPLLSPQSEREGFLHGKRMVDPSGSVSSGGDENFSSPAQSDVGTPAEELKQCPFSGLLDKMDKFEV